MDIALEGNFVVKPSNGWYAKVDLDTGEVGEKKRLADTDTREFWEPLLNDERFKEFVRKKYGIAYGNLMGQTPVLEETENETV
jgi:hypothetical protein